jgi:RNase P/RNase MRP subunit POP5
MKGKPLLPTLRTKKRYVVYDVICDKTIDIRMVFSLISASYKECFGIFGLGYAGLIDTKIYNQEKKSGILKINNKYVGDLRVAMSMIEKIDGISALVKTKITSGILKKAKAIL